MRPLSLLLLLAACAPSDADPAAPVGHADVENPADVESPIVGVERVGVDGPFVAGAIEHFRAEIEGDAAPRWVATGGELVVDGDEVWWTLPEEGAEAVLTLEVAEDVGVFRHDVRVQLLALSPSAAGQIDTTDDETGRICTLVIDGSDVPHVLYLNETHAQWRYARFQGGAWTTELVDGPGFQTGGYAWGDVAGLAVDATGAVHAAFQRASGELVYGRRAPGGGWTVEVAAVDSDVYHADGALIVLDGTTPYLVDTVDGRTTPSGYSRLRVTRKNPGWTSSVQSTFTGPNAGNDFALRGAVRTGAGALRAVFVDYANTYLSSATWTTSGGWASAGVGINGYNYVSSALGRHPGVSGMVAGTGYQGILSGLGLSWSTDGGATWSYSPYHTGNNVGRGLAYDGSVPRIAVRHDTELEYLRPDARGYWTYTTAVTGVDDSSNDLYVLGTALEANGTQHACFSKNGHLWFQ